MPQTEESDIFRWALDSAAGKKLRFAGKVVFGQDWTAVHGDLSTKM